MNGPVFTNPALLGGLALLSVPILIHLLLRLKKRRQRFSTLQFFRRLDAQATCRRKLRNWLLLATRVLLLLLIVLAFARPYLTANPAAARATPRQQVIIILDRSASMSARDTEGSRWERAKTAVQRRIARLNPEDRVVLIGCAAQAETLVEPTTPADVLKGLNALKSTHGTADLGKGLQQAARLLAKTSSFFTNTICVVSDLQRASCVNLGPYPIPGATGLEVLNIGDVYAPNTAVTEVALNSGTAARARATVVNFSAEEFPEFALQLLVDDREVLSIPLHLAAAGSTNVELALPASAPGWHSTQVRIQSRDAQPLDDICYQTFYVAPPVRLLVLEPRQVTKLFQEESFFITSALDPLFGLTNTSRPGFTLEKIASTDLLDRLQRHSSPSLYDVVVLPGLKSIPSGVAPALTKFVGEGGGLLLFLNDGVSINRYNSELPDLLPVALEKLETAADLDWRLWEHEEQSPVFAPFAAPSSGDLSIARFTRRAALKPVANAAALARFQDGVPLIVERTLGRGRVLLINTSADTAWSDWPKHRTFVPWIHSLVRFAASHKAPTPPGAEHTLVAGSQTELDLGPEYKSGTFTLHQPDESELSCKTDAQGYLQDLDLLSAGVYSLRTTTGTELRRWAANIQPAESDLAAMSPSEFERQITRSEPTADLSAAVALFGAHDGRRELWPLLLCGGLVLLLLESLLANRTLA